MNQNLGFISSKRISSTGQPLGRDCRIKSPFRWCLICIKLLTMFNFQGTSRFFRRFSLDFVRSFQSGEAFVFYHAGFALSRTFFIFFFVPAVSPWRDSWFRIPQLMPFVKRFFLRFRRFSLMSTCLPDSLRILSQDSTIVKINFRFPGFYTHERICPPGFPKC